MSGQRVPPASAGQLSPRGVTEQVGYGPPMRALLGLMLTVVTCSCGKSVGLDAGPVDAGFDAGVPVVPVCLADGEDAGAASDAGLDFSCRGRAPAPGGQAALEVMGTVTRAGFVRTPLPGIQVDLLTLEGTVMISTLTDDAGVYRLRHDAGCLPVEGEVRATHPDPDAGFYPSYSVPEAPWRFDRSGLELVLFDGSTRGLVAGLAGVTLVDGTAVLALTVVDCQGTPVEGARVATGSGAGEVRYVGASGLPTSMLSATGPGGDVIVFNLPGRSVEVSATLDGGVVGQRLVPVHPDAATGTFLAP